MNRLRLSASPIDHHHKADDHHCDTGCVQGGAAVNPRSRPWDWCLKATGGVSARPAAGDARDPDRHDHRSGAGLGRNSTTVADRDECVHHLIRVIAV